MEEHNPSRSSSSAASSVASSGRVIAGLVLLTVLAFFAVDLIELVWLQDSDPGTIRTLHETRAIVVSAVTAVLTSIEISRRRRSPFDSSEDDDESRPAHPLVHVARWFLWMRWLACATATILILLTVEVAHLLPSGLLLPLLLCVAALAIANLTFGSYLRQRPEGADRLVKIQVITDLVILTFLLHFSGGIENPLSLLFIFHVIISGILFESARCYRVALTAFALFGVLASLEYVEAVPHYTLEIFPHEGGADHLSPEAGEPGHAAHHGPYVLSRILLQLLLHVTTAYFITTIMERLRAREEETRLFAEREAEARVRLESVVDAAGAGLCLLDENLRPIWTNARFEAWLDPSESTLPAAAHTRQDGERRVTEHQIIEADGRRRHFSTTTAAMPTPEPGLHHVVQLVQEVTARKEAEAQVLHAEKLAAVGQLAGHIVHEINNPLGALSARLELMLKKHEGRSPQELASDLQKMAQLARRITAITRALLGYCRPDPNERQPVHIDPIMERAVVLTQARAKARSTSIEHSLQPDAPLVMGDAGELEQVLVNLLMNAIDASPTGSVVRVHACPCERTGGSPGLRLVVEDAGPGIPEQLRARVFEPFYSTKKPGEGTGLGLSICLRVVRDHGGEIHITNSPSGGARFVVELPVAPSRRTPQSHG